MSRNAAVTSAGWGYGRGVVFGGFGGAVVPGAEDAVGYVFAWLVREACDPAGPGDGVAARLHELVSSRLGPDSALERAREEAREGRAEPSQHTRRRLAQSLEEAAGQDEEFAAELDRLVKQMQHPHGPAGECRQSPLPSPPWSGNAEIAHWHNYGE
ncbi:hypothetical protein FNH09_16365 [Streptomyces adustus]|uniref:Uncharacterized protein n=1 Tax=Streptomyces adustus TaxID=1609272 RepID=A0A5N8VDA0_9ACTN|nr:hypothetical protein [Streptomyces adustus]MPY32786.1 hypothetical protein [Streptomyces adustus]